MFFHQANVPCHRFVKMMSKIDEFKSPHSSYLPDLVASDIYLFADVKQRFVGNIFGSNETVMNIVEFC